MKPADVRARTDDELTEQLDTLGREASTCASNVQTASLRIPVECGRYAAISPV